MTVCNQARAMPFLVTDSCSNPFHGMVKKNKTLVNSSGANFKMVGLV